MDVNGFVKIFYVARVIDIAVLLTHVSSSTTLPVMAFPSSHREREPNAAHSDAENIRCQAFKFPKKIFLQSN